MGESEWLGPGFLAGIAVPVVTPGCPTHQRDLGAKRNYITDPGTSDIITITYGTHLSYLLQGAGG